jgi:homoserine dehydrogenase
MTSTAPLRIGMIGGGTVGGGVYEIIMQRQRELVGSTLRRPVDIAKICVKSLDKPRDFEIDRNKTELTTDPSSILQDDSIDCVVEVMGGTTLAKDIVMQALKAGKSVVTANKALLASCMTELQQTAVQSKQHLCYEAAVCGGIPIIHTLQSGNCYAGDVITSITGILNGTTNYMLTNMENGQDYNEVLSQAQALGYAEADPTADVEGHDVCAKLAILTKLAFGETVQVQQIPTTGISQIKSVDFGIAKQLHCTIKLVGTAKRLHGIKNEGDSVCVFVSPVMMSHNHILASSKGSGNAVAVTSRNLGTCLYTGPGAGRVPTANC